MSVAHFVKVRFDRRSEKITTSWLNARYKFFLDYTLSKSLMLQSQKGLRLWLNFQDGMQEDAKRLIEMLEEYRRCLGISRGHLDYVLTFGDGPAPLQEHDTCGGWLEDHNIDRVYVSRIDSDDLYSRDALSMVRSVQIQDSQAVEAVMFRRGYMYDLKSRQLGVYCNNSSPFHTIIFPRSVFTNRERYLEVFSKVGDHSRVAGSGYKCHGVADWKFTVLVRNHNFMTDMNYSSEPNEPVPIDWYLDNWLSETVTFDVDDFCDEWNCLPDLLELKRTYPWFKCTLFAIPGKCSVELLNSIKHYKSWIELVPHGVHHVGDEMGTISEQEFMDCMNGLDFSIWTRGFKPPRWYLGDNTIPWCNRLGLWVAMNYRDRGLGSSCAKGYYVNGPRPNAHFHSHDVCGNWLHEQLPTLLKSWPKSQRFEFMSKSVLVPQHVYNENSRKR